MGQDKENIEVIIYTPQELNQSCYFITGLFDLESQGKIKCHAKINFNKNKKIVWVRDNQIITDKRQHLKTSFFKVKYNEKEVYFAIDAYDLADAFCEEALLKCAYIFKRNYNSDIANVLMENYSVRILPLGLTFGAKSQQLSHFSWKFFIGFIVGTFFRSVKVDRRIVSRFFREFKKGIEHWYFVKNTRDVQEFRNYEIATQNKVIFQTRCFPGSDYDTRNIQNDRNELINALKNGLGDCFMGGFVPDDISRKDFPDNLTNMPTDREGYLQLVKTASIGIYTRGIMNSPAWKMGEYLSQAKCIVAEQLTTELPVPLEHGKNIMFFKYPAECVEICRNLLNEPVKREQLSLNARRYYEQYVDPAVNVERIISLMIGEAL